METEKNLLDTRNFDTSPLDKEILAYCFAKSFTWTDEHSLGAADFSKLVSQTLWLARDYQDKGIDIQILEQVERQQDSLNCGMCDIYDYDDYSHMDEEEKGKEFAKKNYSNSLTYLIKCYYPASSVAEILRISSADQQDARYINAYDSEALVAACKRGDVDIIKSLFDKGATLYPDGQDHSARLFDQHGKCMVSDTVQAFLAQQDSRFRLMKLESTKESLQSKPKVSIAERLQNAISGSKMQNEISKDKPRETINNHMPSR